ncbi:MAG: MFS transporter [Dehalococcoidales bacterium]
MASDKSGNHTPGEKPEDTGVPSRRFNTFSSLGAPAFRLYMVGMFGQMAAMNMQMLTRSLLVYRVTGSVTAIGIMAVAGMVPHIISSLYGGVIADRLEKKYILMLALAAFAALSFGIAISLTTGWLNAQTWWILIVASVVQSTLMGLLVPARQSIIPALVGREKLMNAVSMNSLGGNAWRLIAPAAAGFMVEGFGFGSVYYIIGGLYVWAMVFSGLLPNTGKLPSTSESVLSEVREGFRYIRREADIMWVLIFNFFAVVLANPYQQLLPVFVDDILGVGAGGLGILISVSGIGAIIGSLVLASLPNRKRGRLLLASTLFLGLIIIAFSFSKSWGLSLGVMVFIGMGQVGRMTLTNTLAQHYSSDSFRGRVMGVLDMQMSFPGLAVFVAAWLTGIIGVEWAISSFALVLVVVSLLITVFVPRLRRLD